MKEYSYQIFIPGGNETALVFGLENNAQIRKSVNDAIMDKFPQIEQVGFLSVDYSKPQLIMAGGEFCGNATRCAAWYYLRGKPGEISIKVSGANKVLKAGITEEHEVWAEMPVYNELDCIKELERGIFLVKMDGIIHIIVMPEQSKPYLKLLCDIKTSAKDILAENKLLDVPAAGVIFLDKEENGLKIHPCVYVSEINTLFYETACGSGTMAVGLVSAFLKRKSIEVSIMQPSLKVIKAIVNCEGMLIKEARILGKLETDGIVHKGIK